MNHYEFTLTFRLENLAENPEKYVEALGASGCDDALVGIGKLGSISLSFTRASKSAVKAVSTAIRDVKQAIPGATLIEANPDFVGMTDIADVYGTSRQYIRKVVTSRSRSFPDPIHEGSPSLWHLADVLGWIGVHEPEKLNRQLFDLAKLNMQINSYKAFMKASSSSNLSAKGKVKRSREETEWFKLIHEAVGSPACAVSGRFMKRKGSTSHAA